MTKKSISTLISVILLILVSIIVISVLLNWSELFTKSKISDASDFASETIAIQDSTLMVKNEQATSTNYSENLLVRNLTSNVTSVITGYKILVSENPNDYNFLNTKIDLETPVELTPGNLGAFEIVCFPSREFDLQLYTDKDTYVNMSISSKPYNNLSCDHYYALTNPPEISVDNLITTDSTYELTGAISTTQGVLSLSLNDVDYTPINNGDNTWSLSNITPGLTPNNSYDVNVCVTDSFNITTCDNSSNELTVYYVCGFLSGSCAGDFTCDGFDIHLRNTENGEGSCSDNTCGISQCAGTCASYCVAGQSECSSADTLESTCDVSTGLRVVSGGDGMCESGICVENHSCPYIFSFNEENYIKETDIFPGATSEDKEYTHYYQLRHLQENDDKYNVQIQEIDPEKSYYDFIQLQIIDAPESVTAILDPDGNIHTYSEPNVLPISCVDDSNNSCLTHIINKENFSFVEPEDTITDSNTYFQVLPKDYIDLVFEEQDTNNTPRLILRVKDDTTTTSSSTETTTTSSTTTTTTTTTTSEDTTVCHSTIHMLVLENGTWIVKDIFKVFAGWDEKIIPLPDLQADEDGLYKVRLYITSYSYEFDYIALDFSEDQDVNVTILEPVNATHSYYGDVVSYILLKDNIYTTTILGDSIDLEFDALDYNSNNRDYVFISKGYYEFNDLER